MMSKCHKNTFIVTINDNSVVEKATKNEVFCYADAPVSRKAKALADTNHA
jgi:hypothetical protein